MKLRLIATFALSLSFLFLSAQSKLVLDHNWSFDVYGDDLGTGGLLLKDLDKNGIADIIVTGTSSSPDGFNPSGMFSIIEFNAERQTYLPKRISRLFSHAITAMTLADVDGDGIDEFLVGFANGEIKVIDSRTFNEVRSLETNIADDYFYYRVGISGLATGDIDNDGTPNIVATNQDTTYIFSMTGKLLRKSAGPGGTLILANIDRDAAIETLYSGGQVLQYSVSDVKKEYTFFPYIYTISTIRTADMNRDNIPDLLYSSRDSVHIVDLANKNRILSIAKGDYGSISDFQLHDYTGDGVPDVFAGNDQFEVLFVFNGVTGQLEFEVHDTHRNGLEALVIGNLDDDPDLEFLYTSGARCTCLDHLYVYDMSTKNLEWMSTFRGSGLNAFDVGRFTGDDEILAIGSQGQHTGWTDRGFISGFILKDKKFAWADKQSEYGPLQYRATAMRFGDIDNDGENELLVGVESSYAFTYVHALDANFNVKHSYEISGMSYVADILIADFDDDGRNEVIVTSGTWVSGSTHPHEWKNFVHIFDGASGNLEWLSAQLGGMSSRVGNIRMGNIDDDPAMELVMLRYGIEYWQQKPAAILVVDGWTRELTVHEGDGYTAIELDDFDKDGIDDIIAGTKEGELLVLSGGSFEEKKQLFHTGSGISALRRLDVNDDDISEFVFADQFRLRVLDVVNVGIIAQTDTLSWRTAEYNSLIVHKNAEQFELIVNAGHTLYSLSLESVPNQPPSAFALISPADNSELPRTEWLEFDWEPSTDDELVTYTLTLRGGDFETVIRDINQTHISISSSGFLENQTYEWSVTATDQYEHVSSETFSFRIVPVITGVSNEVNVPCELYPNPFQNSLLIRNAGTQFIDEIRINDLRGGNHLKQNVSLPVNSEMSLTGLEGFPAGMYICTLASRGTVVGQVKLIKY